MTRHEGQGRLEEDGRVVADVVHVYLDDDPERAPSYAHGRAYGELWLDDGDLMSRLPSDARCELVLDDGSVKPIRINSYDRGGARAQVVVLGA